jgi:hypothetical protein
MSPLPQQAPPEQAKTAPVPNPAPVVWIAGLAGVVVILLLLVIVVI